MAPINPNHRGIGLRDSESPERDPFSDAARFVLAGHIRILAARDDFETHLRSRKESEN